MVDVNTTDENLQIPDKSVLYEIAGSAYADNYTGNIDGFSLLKQTPTLKFFKKEDYPVIVIGVRGTADFEDFMAWLPVVFDTIVETQRYIKDTASLTQVQANYLPSQYYYYATGHSIAGVIIDEWLKSGMILKGRTYNPAIQPKDLSNTSIQNVRIYSSGDPLYNLFGRRARRTPEVRQSKTVGRYSRFISPFFFGRDMLGEHNINNPVFVGGSLDSLFMSKFNS
jgi:hypothetical protein